MYDLIILGGGAAGLFCAANLKGIQTLLIDHKETLGKKLAITGGGMCNLTNTNQPEEFLSHFGSKAQRNFLLPALHNFPQEALMEWFVKRGLDLSTREDGKVFPTCLDAHAVIELLINEAKKNRVEMQTLCQIERCSKLEDGTFLLQSGQGEFKSKALAFATGGMGYPSTGSDGSAYALAKSLGHSIIPPTPALAAVKIESYPYQKLAGNALRDVLVDFTHSGENKRYKSIRGDVLFTHDGLSGPAILNASRDIRSGDILSCTLLGTNDRKALAAQLEEALLSNTKKQVTTILREQGLFLALAEQLVLQLNLEKTVTGSQLGRQARQQLVHSIVEHRLLISTKKGFNAAMVTCGGINLGEVNRKTMASKLTENLFFCGEVLDYDGDTGGYNLQAAFSTAHLVASQVMNQPNKE